VQGATWHSWLVDEIKARISVRELAEEAGAVFTKDASACPLHGGDNRSAFHLRDQDTRWHCFTRCPEGHNDGDVIDFYRYWKGVDHMTALRDLAERAIGESVIGERAFDERRLGKQGSGYPSTRQQYDSHAPGRTIRVAESLPAPPPRLWRERGRAFVDWACAQLAESAEARSYLVNRGLTLETAAHWRLGWNPSLWKRPAESWGLNGEDAVWLHPGIVIPHLDADGGLWGIKIRVFEDGCAVGEKGGKYRGPRGASTQGMLFGERELRRMSVLLLAEGEFDALLAWQEAGDLCDVSTLAGARKRLHLTALTVIAQYPAVLAVLDDDTAADEGRAYLGQIPRIRTLLPPDHDLTDYHVHGGDLRRWIATQVTETMVRLLEGLDGERQPALFEAWLEMYTRADDARRGQE
jgi:hypothetical protein